eukprot:TRINITY_DN7700_c0_g1_i1.p1 TRINITY_DN7700_c0_g1~~TRINITY_DN7700_c0_g1_i1.p1  ORF type:complete len:744 (+),score=126.55 TRINITY_DN7700_c0_g1_i1:159-2390(+)
MGEETLGLGSPRFGSHRLELVRGLGRGAFGEVTLVRAVPSGVLKNADGDGFPLLALKRVPVAQLSTSAKDTAIAEARLLRQLGTEHKSILRCLDFHVTKRPTEVLELLLEFASLGDLNNRIRASRHAGTANERRVPVAELVAYGRDLAAGLAHLHSLRPKVFHRDVKPGNVVLFAEDSAFNKLGRPCAKLADFGIAKLLECEGSFADAATVVGTPHYFSPELCQGLYYDERADAWACGCVLYEMICLHRPFHRAEGNLAILALRISEGAYDKNALEERCAACYSGDDAAISSALLRTTLGLLEKSMSERWYAHDALLSLHELGDKLGCWAPGGVVLGNDFKPLDVKPEEPFGGSSDAATATAGDNEVSMSSSGPVTTDSWAVQPGFGTVLPSSLDDAVRLIAASANVESPVALSTRTRCVDPMTFAPGQVTVGPPVTLAPPTLLEANPTTDEPVTFLSPPGTRLPTPAGTPIAFTQNRHATAVPAFGGGWASSSRLNHDLTESLRSSLAGTCENFGSSQRLLETQYLDGGNLGLASANEEAAILGGGASRLAWGGAAPLHEVHEDADQEEDPRDAESNAGAGEPTAPSTPARPPGPTRIFMRPLRRERSSGKVDPMTPIDEDCDGPVVFVFAPFVRRRESAPGAIDLGQTDQSVMSRSSVQSAPAAPFQGWLEVQLPSSSGNTETGPSAALEAAIGEGGKCDCDNEVDSQAANAEEVAAAASAAAASGAGGDDEGFFSLTAVE